MIVELIMKALSALFTFLAGLFPDTTVPAWWGTLQGHVSDVTSQMAPLGVWVPFGAAGDALGFVLVAVAAAVVIKIVRIVASFASAGGGSAA